MNILKLSLLVAAVAGALACENAFAEESKVRLFILSGQSNMAGLNPDISFTPTVREHFAGDDVIVVKSAQGGQPIRRWFKEWKPADESKSPKSATNYGDLYNRLMAQVRQAVGEKKPDSICFVWMQGERDAKEQHHEVYASSLEGVVDQLRNDLNHEHIGVVVGRLSDYGTTDSWEAIRKAQVELGESNAKYAWVDTDDLNGKKDGLHYTKEGYAELGRRFAAKAIEVVEE